MDAQDLKYLDKNRCNGLNQLKTLNENVEQSKLFINEFSKLYYQGIDFSKDKTSSILDTSIVTHKDSWNKDVENKLSFILKRYKEQN